MQLGEDVNAADNYAITPLMVAANMGEIPIIQYLIDRGADLGARDLGKKNDGAFGSRIEPPMPIDYAIGAGTFVPNNAVIMPDTRWTASPEVSRLRIGIRVKNSN